MINFIKNLFAPKQESGTDFEFPVTQPTTRKLETAVKTWRVGMWVIWVEKNVVGIIAGFDNGAVQFHEVNPDTGATIMEHNISVDAIRQAKYAEVPTCRMSISRDAAKERGYDH